MKLVLLAIIFACILAIMLGVSVMYMSGPVLLRCIVAGLLIVPASFFSVAAIDLFLEEL